MNLVIILSSDENIDNLILYVRHFKFNIIICTPTEEKLSKVRIWSAISLEIDCIVRKCA